jgi:hypothetical protein
MLKFKLFTIYVFFETLLCGCSADKKREDFEIRPQDYAIERVGKMNKEEVMESSGIELADDSNFWTHADGGNLPVLYKVDATGKLLNVLEVPNTANQDWEDLAKDEEGHIYIGDFGNNENKRHNLRIFRINEQAAGQVDTIRFTYADQNLFPPEKADRNFDCEAFFYHRGHLYLFTKDRGKNELVKVYKVPAKPGSYEASAIDSIQISTMITAADISPDGKKMALLGYGNIYLFDIKGTDDFFSGKKYCIPFEKTGQAEALVFINNTDFVFTNEGGKIFKAVEKRKK